MHDMKGGSQQEGYASMKTKWNATVSKPRIERAYLIVALLLTLNAKLSFFEVGCRKAAAILF